MASDPEMVKTLMAKYPQLFKMKEPFVWDPKTFQRDPTTFEPLVTKSLQNPYGPPYDNSAMQLVCEAVEDHITASAKRVKHIVVHPTAWLAIHDALRVRQNGRMGGFSMLSDGPHYCGIDILHNGTFELSEVKIETF